MNVFYSFVFLLECDQFKRQFILSGITKDSQSQEYYFALFAVASYQWTESSTSKHASKQRTSLFTKNDKRIFYST